MSTDVVARPRTIADLPDLSEIIPDPAVAGFPEDFSDLFARTQARLLRGVLRDAVVVVAFRNNDLREMAANPALGRSIESPHFQRFLRNSVFSTNPPIHGPMRLVVARPLSPKHIPRLSQVAQRVATELIDELVGQGEIDFCSQYSECYTARFWGALFKMTNHEVERLIEAVRAIAPAFRLNNTSEEIVAINNGMDRYLELVGSAVHRALEHGGNELLEAMAAAYDAVDGEGKPERLGEMIAANVFDGLHTAAVAGTNSLYQLLSTHDSLGAVRADLSLVSNALAEGLRLSPPIITTRRYALGDLELAGTLIPQGTTIAMLWAAGNRDPEVFEHPDRYDLFRRQQSQTTFGGGVHICPGRHVAGMLARVMLETVLAPGVQIELTGDRPAWLKHSSARQLDRMQVAIRRDQSR